MLRLPMQKDIHLERRKKSLSGVWKFFQPPTPLQAHVCHAPSKIMCTWRPWILSIVDMLYLTRTCTRPAPPPIHQVFPFLTGLNNACDLEVTPKSTSPGRPSGSSGKLSQTPGTLPPLEGTLGPSALAKVEQAELKSFPFVCSKTAK